MDKKSLIVLALAIVLAANALVSSCGRKGPEAPPDTLPPTIVSTTPYYNEGNVPLNTAITVNFNETMSSSSVSGETIAVFQGTGNVAGTASCAGSSAVFKPDANLSPNTTYRVSITTGVRDVSGNAMVAPFVFSFVTGTTTAANTFTVTATADVHGTILPAGPTSVASQATPTFTISPDAGYETVLPVGGTCGGNLAAGIFTTQPVKADCTVTASFQAASGATHTVIASVGANGMISPAGAVPVSHGSTRTFTITANPGYHITTPVGGTCGGTLSGSSYITNPVNGDCTVSAGIAADAVATHTVTASAGSNGTISPSGAVTVNHGSTRTFTITANSGYHVATPVGGTCGGNLSGSTYTTNAVNGDCTVSASFSADAVVTHTVTATPGDHGDISPKGSVTVNHGSTRTFTISPSKGYRTVTPVGGTCGGSLSGTTYTTNPVNSNCTVSPTFARITATVTPAPGPHGTMVPGLPQTVSYEEKASFSVTPDATFHVASASGCGGSLAGSLFTTGPVIEDCTVAASFAANVYTVTPSAGPHGAIAPATPQQAAANASLVFTVTPEAAYRVASVSGCAGSLSGSSYTTGPIAGDCTVAALFAASMVTVTPSAGTNGQIAPADPQQVTLNSIVKFNLTPSAGYAISSVSGCGGTLVGTVYTTAPVTADCTVAATFVQSIPI